MRNIAEFTLIGRVGTIKQVGKTVRVTVCANYPFKDKGGEWKDDQHWNEVTFFTKSIQDYVNEHVSKGDLVHVRGRAAEQLRARRPADLHRRPDWRRVRPARPGRGAVSRLSQRRGGASLPSPFKLNIRTAVSVTAFDALARDQPGSSS